MKHFKNKTEAVCFMGLGIALYVALSYVVRVPVFENYYLCLGYIAMAVYLYLFGVLPGTVVGAVGCVLYCILTSGMRGMPGWTLGNVVIGIVLGTCFTGTAKIKSKILQTGLNAVFVVGAVTLGILGVKSFTETVLYAQPFLVRVAKNSYAFVADVVVLVASLPVCLLVKKAWRKQAA